MSEETNTKKISHKKILIKNTGQRSYIVGGVQIEAGKTKEVSKYVHDQLKSQACFTDVFNDLKVVGKEPPKSSVRINKKKAKDNPENGDPKE